MTRTTTATLLLAVALLAGCSSKGQAIAMPDTTPTPASASTTAGPDIPGFILAFRMKYPTLTEGRTDKAIRNDVLNTCSSIRAGETKTVLNRQVTGRFGSHDGKAPTRAQVAGILALLAEHGCAQETT
jgi:hypothetical protein